MATATKVNACNVSDCVYNSNSSCHALAITIDDPTPATCSTYKKAENGESGGAEAQIANIGACKAAGCMHNENLMCTAGEVTIGVKDGKVSCLSYQEG